MESRKRIRSLGEAGGSKRDVEEEVETASTTPIATIDEVQLKKPRQETSTLETSASASASTPAPTAASAFESSLTSATSSTSSASTSASSVPSSSPSLSSSSSNSDDLNLSFIPPSSESEADFDLAPPKLSLDLSSLPLKRFDVSPTLSSFLSLVSSRLSSFSTIDQSKDQRITNLIQQLTEAGKQLNAADNEIVKQYNDINRLRNQLEIMNQKLIAIPPPRPPSPSPPPPSTSPSSSELTSLRLEFSDSRQQLAVLSTELSLLRGDGSSDEYIKLKEEELNELEKVLESGKKRIEEERKRRRRCRVCNERDSGVTFHPCQHTVCCSTCSQEMETCPLCKTNIDKRVLLKQQT